MWCILKFTSHEIYLEWLKLETSNTVYRWTHDYLSQIGMVRVRWLVTWTISMFWGPGQLESLVQSQNRITNCFWLIVVICGACNIGESLVELKTEADPDGTDVTDYQQPYSCTVCGEKFATEMFMQVHVKSHTLKKQYSCTLCEKSYRSLNSLHIHMNVHTEKYKCDECGECFQSRQQLAVHRKRKKPHECDVCGKRFAKRANLVIHGRIHSGEKPYKCHICDKAYRDASSLNGHIRSHRECCTSKEDSFSCSKCEKHFSSARSLCHHMNMHERYYICTECDKVCHSNQHLAEHKAEHMGRHSEESNPLECLTCKKAFATPSKLAIHMRVHTGERPFKCTLCGRSFSQNGNLKRHKCLGKCYSHWYKTHTSV